MKALKILLKDRSVQKHVNFSIGKFLHQVKILTVLKTSFCPTDVSDVFLPNIQHEIAQRLLSLAQLSVATADTCTILINCVHIKMIDRELEVILETIMAPPDQQAEPNQLIVPHKKIYNQ